MLHGNGKSDTLDLWYTTEVGLIAPKECFPLMLKSIPINYIWANVDIFDLMKIYPT